MLETPVGSSPPHSGLLERIDSTFQLLAPSDAHDDTSWEMLNRTGSGLADLFNISQLVSSWASLGANSWNVLSIRSNKPLWGGLLPTGVSNIHLPIHTSTAPTFALTQS